MPTYEYECDACGHKFEKFQSIKARPIRTCPVCKEKAVNRLLGTGGALIFKGSGFYCTDYRSSGYRAAAKKDSEGSTGTSGSKSSDSKPGGDSKPSASKKD